MCNNIYGSIILWVLNSALLFRELIMDGIVSVTFETKFFNNNVNFLIDQCRYN